MDKAQVLEVLDEATAVMGIPEGEYVVGFGAALVLMGLRETTRDINLDVTRRFYENCIDLGVPPRRGLFGDYIQWGGDITLHKGVGMESTLVEGVPCHTPCYLLHWYRRCIETNERRFIKLNQDSDALIALERYFLLGNAR